jgi:sugar/nucleoside kinase (ribokinase family)
MFEPDLEEIKDVKIVSLGSMMIPPFVTVESIDRVVKKAKEIGAIVCADVIYSPGCSMEELGKNGTLQYIDYIFPNEEEARLLTGKDTVEEMADVLLGYGIKNVLIKVGAEGVYIKNQDGVIRVPAVGHIVVDTTGAGDNFAAGFITGLVEGKDLTECAYLAAATAGVAIQYIGANTGVKSREQVEKHLEANRVS